MVTKKTIILVLMMALLPLSNVYVYADPTEVLLEVSIIDPENDQPDGPRTPPVLIPEISIQDYTIYLNTPCDGCTLRLLDEDGYVVYTTVIPNGSTNLVLPSYLSGEYEIQIIQGNLCFYGYIIL